MRGRIAYKLAAISLAVAVPLFIILAASFVDRYQTRVQLIQQGRIGYARLSAQAFRSLVEDAQRGMRLLGHRYDEMQRSPEEAEPMLDWALDPYPASHIVFTDHLGRCVAASDARLIGRDFSEGHAYRDALQAEDGGGIEPSSVGEDGSIGLYVAQRIDDASGGMRGMALMRVDVEQLHEQFPVDVETGGISIIDSAGQVVFQNESITYARQRARWADVYPFVRSALDGEDSPTDDFAFPGGGTRIGAFVPLEPYGWAAGSSVDEDVPLASFWRSARRMFPLAAGFSALGLLIAVWISLRLRRAVVSLAGDAERLGDGDFETPIVTDRADEIGALAVSLERARQDLKRFAEENARLYEAEHEVAEKLQSALLSVPSRVEGVEFGVRYHSATDTARVGGDFFDIFPLDDGRIGITVGDISGHGLDAAVLTSLVKTAIRVRASEPHPTPEGVLATANQVLLAGSPEEVYATAMFVLLGTDDGKLTYSSGGHPAGVIVSATGVRRLPANSAIVGAFAGVVFDCTDEQLAHGELLFLYTDGLIEARREGEEFGEGRLLELLARLHGESPEDVVERVFQEALAFTSGCLRDDLAILAVRLTRVSG